MLNTEWGLMVWTLITFGLAVFVLWKYAFGPLQRVIDEQRDLTWHPSQVDAAQAEVKAASQAEWARIEQGQAQLAHRQREALAARAGRLLLDATLVELALGQNPSLFGDEGYPTAFDEQAVMNLKRHRYPWASLLRLVWERMKLVIEPSAAVPVAALFEHPAVFRGQRVGVI